MEGSALLKGGVMKTKIVDWCERCNYLEEIVAEYEHGDYIAQICQICFDELPK